MWFDTDRPEWGPLDTGEPMSTGELIFLSILCAVLGFCIAYVIFYPSPLSS